MTRPFTLVTLMILTALLTPFVTTSAVAEESTDIEILHTAVNPANNKTYHLLSEGSWSESAQVARALDGFLTTVNDANENQWIVDTFANYDEQARHLWIGLSDYQNEGDYRWHDGTPFHYRNWGADQPSEIDSENYVHIAGTNMGNIMPGTWNDLDNDPQYFPVYGVVEVGEAVDYALRFNGNDNYVIIDEDLPIFTSNITITARINLPDTTGINFISMLGDYGWGLYVNDGQIGYSNQYSIARHPTSNLTINENVWTEVSVQIEENVGGTFLIDGQIAGTISAEDSIIPQGDFGSNDCYQSTEDCDELFIGKMGAGCDCNYFGGMIDFVAITNQNHNLSWHFLEGEGPITNDNSEAYQGEIVGAAWVMPDGTIVAQAIQLFSDQPVFDISGQAGDQLLFFIEIEPYTKELYFNVYKEYIDWGDYEDHRYDVYFAHDYIPSMWENDDYILDNYDYMWNEFYWPEEGIFWMVIVPLTDIEDLTIYSYVEIADPPPSLDEMTELVNEIPITGQKINAGRGAPDEDRVLYYYVNVTENLSALNVKTYGGTGNIDLAISAVTVPDPFDSFFGWEEPWFDDWDDFGVIGGIFGGGFDSDWSSGPGNEHQVNLYNLEPAIYFVTAYTYGKANDFTISASMSFEPQNIEPEDAIELSPGISYGPLSGYNGLSQYFKINVPDGVERLEVDLNNGFGEASLFMKLSDSPTTSDFTHSSNSPGAGDKIGFNDPTPGMWYILIETEFVFGDVDITASFEDRYVWQYDGNPIQLFNQEELSGIEAPAGETLRFFVELEKPGNYLIIQTYGGNGDLTMTATGTVMTFVFDDFFDFFEESGRQRPGDDLQAQTVVVDSDGFDTYQEIYLDLPANGVFDIVLNTNDGFSDVNIVASWEYSDFIDPIDDSDDDDIDSKVTQDCRKRAETEMMSKDTNSDGVLDKNEFSSLLIGDEKLDFNKADLNRDGEIEFAEVLQISCSCGNELALIFDQLSPNGNEVGIEKLSSQAFENNYEFFEIDANSNLQISQSEIDILILLCETSFDAFDGDGDGVPDKDDAFPNDPDESKDTDGDGVGDNADLAPSLSNDLIYSAGAILAIGLLAMLVLVSRGSRSRAENDTWNSTKQYNIAEQMLGMQDGTDNIDAVGVSVNEQPSAITNSQDVTAIQQPLVENNFFDELLNDSNSPPSQLLGNIDHRGVEVIEYPMGSGEKWQRNNHAEPWKRR